MEYSLVKIKNHYYLLSDEEAYPYAYHIKYREVLKVDGVGEISGEIFHNKGFNFASDCKKVAASTDISLGLPGLNKSEIDKILGIEDIKKKADLYSGNPEGIRSEAFIEGYLQCLLDNDSKKFTSKNLLEIRNKVVSLLPTGDVDAWNLIQSISDYTKWLDEYTGSIENQMWKVEAEYSEIPNLEIKSIVHNYKIIKRMNT